MDLCRKTQPHVLSDLMLSPPKRVPMFDGEPPCRSVIARTSLPREGEPLDLENLEIDDAFAGYKPRLFPELHRLRQCSSDRLLQPLNLSENHAIALVAGNQPWNVARPCLHPDGCALQRTALIKAILNLIRKALRNVAQFMRRGRLAVSNLKCCICFKDCLPTV